VAADALVLAVNGTLMRGLELNGNLLRAGARFLREARTAPAYRLYSIGDVHPAMQRVAEGGVCVALELWELPAANVARVLREEPAGLCVGKVELEDGAQVLGVLGEAWLCARGRDITTHGGWRAYLATQQQRTSPGGR
jgi:gamma-glutamylcyclotransferase (GGCT)/AIG2-like uncharacterized protein YtfP